MELSHNSSPIETQVESLCKNIVRKSAEFWEDRNKAIIELTSLVSNYEGASPERIYEIFNINVFRSFVEPVKLMILDLRSQQVRDTCAFLTRLSIITKDLMRHFLRESFESIYTASKVPNKVMSGYVDDCILSLIRHTTFKSSIQLISTDARESRSKGVRERCLAYINEMLLCWDIQEKEADLFQEAIRSGLSDASVRGRELARLSYLNFREIFPKRADKLKNELHNSGLRARLEKEEEIHDHEKESMNYLKEYDHASSHQSSTQTTTIETTGENSNESDADAILLESTAMVPQNAHLLRRQTHNDDAISSIQALIRGNLVRRQSSRYAFLDSHEDNATKTLMEDNQTSSHLPSHIILSIAEENERRLSSLSDISSQPNSPEKQFNEVSNGTPSSPLQPKLTSAPIRSSSRGTDESLQSSDSSPFHIKIGMTAFVIGKDPEVRGIVQYVGQTTFASGYWVGLRLDSPNGKNDGSVQGTQYFECPPLHGLFVRPGQLKIINEDNSPEYFPEQQDDLEPKKTEDGVIRTNADTLRETLNIAYALKVKLAKSMKILNQQLEIVEIFEGRVESNFGVGEDDCADFISTIIELLNEDANLISEFRNYLPK